MTMPTQQRLTRPASPAESAYLSRVKPLLHTTISADWSSTPNLLRAREMQTELSEAVMQIPQFHPDPLQGFYSRFMTLHPAAMAKHFSS